MGYLLKDERVSGGTVQEWDTVSCRHCQAVIKKEGRFGWNKKGGFCLQCGGPTCLPCAKRQQTVGCEPWQKKIDDYLTRQEWHRSLRRVGISC